MASIIKSSIRQCLGSPIFAPSKPLYVILNGFVQSGGLTAERKRNTSYKKNPYSTASHLRKIWAVNLEAVSISNAPTSHFKCTHGEERDTLCKMWSWSIRKMNSYRHLLLSKWTLCRFGQKIDLRLTWCPFMYLAYM